MGEKQFEGRPHMSLPPQHTEEYKAQSRKAHKSYKAVADINKKAREQHMSYGQYVAAEWAKTNVVVRRPKEESCD